MQSLSGVAAGASLNEAVAALGAVMMAFEGYRDAEAAYLGLTVSEARAITHVHAADGIGQAELGRQLGFTTSSVTAIVDRLERNGVAERTPHPSDRRRHIVRLTAPGVDMLRLTGQWLGEAFAQIDSAAQAVLIPGLAEVAQNLAERTERIRASPSFAARLAPLRRH